MELKQLRIFLVVAKLQSFTKAAKELNYSQSSVSEHIINLESKLEVKLFDRINRKIFLTSKGKELEVYANRIIELCDETIDIMKNPKEPSGDITIGITESLCSYKFPSFFRDYLSKYKNVNLCFKIARCEELPIMINNKEVDIAFTLDEKADLEKIKTIELFEEEIVFISSVENPLSKKENLSYSDFDNEKIVLSQGVTGYNKIMDQIYKRENIKEGSILYMESLEGIKSYVKQGFGISFIPRVVIEKEILEKELRIINVGGEKFYHIVKILVHENKYIDRALKNLINEAMATYKSL